MDEHTTEWALEELRRKLTTKVSEAGISGYRLCQASGLPRSSWSNFIHGKTNLSAESLLRVCITLGLDPGAAWPSVADMEQEHAVRTYSPF
jgi:transcriptional regulator with XRE-family HTH domain